MAKDVRDLTVDEAKQILEFAYPNDEYNTFRGLSFRPKIDDEGKQQISFGFRSIIGIEFHNGQDMCILHFDNTRVVLWLYRNGYDISEMLEANSHFSEMEKNFDNYAFEVHMIGENAKSDNPVLKSKITLEYVLKELKNYNEKYFYVDYE